MRSYATSDKFNYLFDIVATCPAIAGCIELTKHVDKLQAKVDELQREVDNLKAKDSILNLLEVCLSLKRFITFEVFGAGAKREERHQFGLLNSREKNQLDSFLESLGMDRKLFKVLKEFGNDTAHVNRPSMSAKDLEALICDDADYQKTKERKQQFLAALAKYKIIRPDGTVDVSSKPVFT